MMNLEFAYMFQGLELVVKASIYPAEAQSRDSPAWPEEVEIHSAEHNGVDFDIDGIYIKIKQKMISLNGLLEERAIEIAEATNER